MVDNMIHKMLAEKFQMSFKKSGFIIGVSRRNCTFDYVSENKRIVISKVGFSSLPNFIIHKTVFAESTEAIINLNLLPEDTKKILILKKRIFGKNSETVAEFLYNNDGYFLKDVELWEIDEKFNIKVYKYSGNLLNKSIANNDTIELEKKNLQVSESLYNVAYRKEKEDICSINHLWNYGNEDDWDYALEKYWSLLRKENLPLEREFEDLDSTTIEAMSVEEFYDFLFNKYFVWKFTAKNRLATTRKSLSRYVNENLMDELGQIKIKLFSFDKKDSRNGLYIASKIRGLGIAGASGLLAILFPKYFGTVDQFVVKSLCKIEGLSDRELLTQMRPEELKPQDGVILEEIMRSKANELNNRFNTEQWTPRMIDKVLWSFER